MALLRPDGTLCIVGLPNDKITVSVLDVVFNQKKVRVGSCGRGTAQAGILHVYGRLGLAKRRDHDQRAGRRVQSGEVCQRAWGGGGAACVQSGSSLGGLHERC